MKNGGRPAWYTTAQALRAILETDDVSNLEDSDTSDAEEEHIWEQSDLNDTETIEPAAGDHIAASQHPQADYEPARGRVRGRDQNGDQALGPSRGQGHGQGSVRGCCLDCGSSRGRGHGLGDHGLGGQLLQNALDTVLAGGPDPVQDVLFGRNETVWQKNAPNVGRRRAQGIRQSPGITGATNYNSLVEAFSFFITQTMIDLVVLGTNREAWCWVTEWNNANPGHPKRWAWACCITVARERRQAHFHSNHV